MGDAMDDERIKKLQSELEEAQETLRAIREGEVDALVVDGPHGPQLFSLKSAEQPYRMLVEQMQEGAVTLTTAGDVLYCNHCFAQMVGVPPEQIVGGRLERFVAPAARARLAETLRAGRGRHEAHLVSPDGREIPVYLSVGTFQFDGVESVCLVATDLTELIHTRAARAEAEAASRAKDEFIAMLSHELRNPLSPILTALQLMKLRGIDAAERERTIIERQVGHLVGLVDDLLDVSRITRGKIELKKEYVELTEVVANAVETASPLLEERQHSLDVRVPRRGCSIHGDRERLAQVVANLLTNAAKYTEPKGSIEINAGREEDSVVISVRDTGIGIDQAMQASVFDVFTQARQALDRSQGGLGLGLAIVRSLVTLHGGTVGVFSEGLGRGTTFKVRLPYAAMPHGVSPDEGRPEQQAQSSGAGRILLVDDNRDSAEMLAEALSALGYATHVAFDAPGALRAVQELPFDVALLDIGLPVMSGYELAQRLRESPASAHIALVAVTGYGQPRDRVASGDAGFDAHLVKPVDIEQVAHIVRTLTKDRQQRPQARG
jgi:PAS domain S-box-containing protein